MLNYGFGDNWAGIVTSLILDFQVGIDTLALFDFDVSEANFKTLVTQTVMDGNLHISLNDFSLFSGVQADFTVVDDGNGDWMVTHIATGDVDTLFSVETFGFLDGYLVA